MIKAVAFDLHQTLAYRDPKALAYAQEATASYLRGQGYEVTTKKFAEVHQENIEKVVDVFHSQYKEVTFAGWWKGILNDLGITYGVELVNKMSEVYADTLVRFISLYPGVRKMLQDLSLRFRLGLISNSLADITRKDLKALSIVDYFDVIVISSDIGIRKPDPSIFRFALNKLEVDADESVFIGDEVEDDVAGARGVGMKTVLVKDERPLKLFDIKPDYIVAEVTDILKLPLFIGSRDF